MDGCGEERMIGGQYADAISFSSGMEYVVLKAQRREESNVIDALRTLRSHWRWLVGLPPLRNPGRRLADHYAWIHDNGSDDSSHGGSCASSTGVRSRACCGPCLCDGGRAARARTALALEATQALGRHGPARPLDAPHAHASRAALS